MVALRKQIQSLVDYVSKVSRAIGFLKYCRKFLPQNTLSKMYRGIVKPHFGSVVRYGGAVG